MVQILINGLPTGASDTQGAYTPDECHLALIAENPSYAPLIVAQKPNWVKPPLSYTPSSSSSLVMAFEDPDSNIARVLLEAKHLYAFGTYATLRKWKQHPTPPTPSSPASDDTETEIVTFFSSTSLPFSFSPSSPVPAAVKPFT